MKPKRSGKRSIEKTVDSDEKTIDSDQGKKKKGEESRSARITVQEDIEKKMDMVSEVSIVDQDKINKRSSEAMEQEVCEPSAEQVLVGGPGRRTRLVKRNGVMFYEDEPNKENERKDREKEQECYKGDHKGEIVVQASVADKYKGNNRMANMLKIAREIAKEGIKIKELKQSGLATAEIKFHNIIEANDCLKIGKDSTEDRQIKYMIPGRMQRIKGVISDWDRDIPIHELYEALDDKSRVIKLEKMKRRYVDEKTKESTFRFTDQIMITFEGNELPERVSLYGKVLWLKIRAFMEPVKQCFGCYEYGHFRQWCRYNGKRCMVCGKNFHGKCEEPPKCINCGGNHVATDKKKCEVYEYNLNLKKTMADRNISIHEAKKIVKRPNFRRQAERYRESSQNRNREEVQKVREGYDQGSRGWYEKENNFNFNVQRVRRSYAEIARSNNKDRNNNGEDRSSSNKRIKSTGPEEENEEKRNKAKNSMEVEVSSPGMTNMTTMAYTTRYLSEELKAMRKVLERDLMRLEERQERFEESQRRLQQEFFEKLLQYKGMIIGQGNKDKEKEEGDLTLLKDK